MTSEENGPTRPKARPKAPPSMPQRIDLHAESQCCLDHNAWPSEMPASLEGFLRKEDWEKFVEEMNELESHVCNPNWGFILTFCILCAPYALWRMPKVNDSIADLQNECLERWHERWKNEHNLPNFLFYRHDASCHTIVIDIPTRTGRRASRKKRGRRLSLLDRHRAAASARRKPDLSASEHSYTATSRTSATSLRPPRLLSPPASNQQESTPTLSEKTSPAGSQIQSFPASEKLEGGDVINSETNSKLRKPPGGRPVDHELYGSGEIRPLFGPPITPKHPGSDAPPTLGSDDGFSLFQPRGKEF